MSAISFLLITLQALALVSRSYQACRDIGPPQHGRIMFGQGVYFVDCDQGYIAQGNRIGRCKNNKWDKLPTCIKSDHVCMEPPAPENGEKYCDQPPLSWGKLCRFRCYEGYRIEGIRGNARETRARCQLYGWAELPHGLPLRCIPISSTLCPVPPPLKDGKVIGCSSTRLPSVSERCHFRCNEGYVRRGPPFVTCREPGILTDEDGNVENFPKCIVPEVYPSKQNRDYIPAERALGHTPPEVSSGGSEDMHDTCYNHQCEQLCKIEKGRAQCRCNGGYVLNLEDQKSCIEIKKRVRYASNPCAVNNGGCEHLCSLTNSREVFCSCRQGYTRGGSDLKNCIEDTPQPYPVADAYCHENNGGCEQSCADTGMGVRCSCRKGYVLHSDGKHCLDIDECSNEDLNNCQHYCTNTVGSYSCFCKSGYVVVDNKCEGCGKNSYWSLEFGGCSKCPKNTHTESEGRTSVRDCVCDSGFAGNLGDDIECKDIDECFINNFGCSHTCVNIPGSAYCTCSLGFVLDKDNKTCIDMDECSIKNGGCEGFCHNLNGSFRCSCPEGYVSSNKDFYTCEDVDECQVNNGGCEQMCINYGGGYYCACESGYRLDRGLKNCTDVRCPILPVPPHSYMTCKHNGQRLASEQENYSVGTVCVFPCDRGFKNTRDRKRMECQEDGTWEGTMPICKAQHCDPLNVPENGAVHPSSCSIQGNSVRQKCTYTCNPGYILVGNSIFECKNNLTWNSEKFPICQPEKIQPSIECPPDITATLLPGKNSHSIILQEPVTNTGSYKVNPDWINIGIPIQFRAGITKVTFNAISPNSNKTAKCVTTISVLDQEPPVFESCPDSIYIEGAGIEGEFVTWDLPVVTDNVQVESVSSISEPNTTLTPGTYVVEYIARDVSGNIASCSFEVSIIRMKCSDLIDPAHGEANCVDWMFGKLCQPQCQVGYMRDPEEPLYYSCDDSGVWEPSDVISECLQIIPAIHSTCPDGFLLKTNGETSEEVCIDAGTKNGQQQQRSVNE